MCSICLKSPPSALPNAACCIQVILAYIIKKYNEASQLHDFGNANETSSHDTYVLQVEGLVMDSTEALAYLGQIGEATSLRHAVQLLTPAAMMAKTSGRDEISSSDVEQVAELFHDAKFTAKLLAEQADKYVQ